MLKILFLCHGNICRSPMAEFIMKDLVNQAGMSSEFVIESKALTAEELGNDMYPPAKECLDAHNIPYTSRQATLFTKIDYENFDYIFIMNKENKHLIDRVVQGEKIKFLNGEIADPWFTGDFETSYSQIKEGCKRILQNLSHG